MGSQDEMHVKTKKPDKMAGKLTLCENEELGRFSSISRGRCVWVGGGGGGGGVGVWSGGRGGGGIHASGMEMGMNTGIVIVIN